MADSSVQFVPHCDYPTCDLGGAWFDCPKCCYRVVDYGDLWFEPQRGKTDPIEIYCEYCQQHLVAVYRDGDWVVEECR